MSESNDYPQERIDDVNLAFVQAQRKRHNDPFDEQASEAQRRRQETPLLNQSEWETAKHIANEWTSGARVHVSKDMHRLAQAFSEVRNDLLKIHQMTAHVAKVAPDPEPGEHLTVKNVRNLCVLINATENPSVSAVTAKEAIDQELARLRKLENALAEKQSASRLYPDGTAKPFPAPPPYDPSLAAQGLPPVARRAYACGCIAEGRWDIPEYCPTHFNAPPDASDDAKFCELLARQKADARKLQMHGRLRLALHHLQSDGTMDRRLLAETLNDALVYFED